MSEIPPGAAIDNKPNSTQNPMDFIVPLVTSWPRVDGMSALVTAIVLPPIAPLRTLSHIS